MPRLSTGFRSEISLLWEHLFPFNVGESGVWCFVFVSEHFISDARFLALKNLSSFFSFARPLRLSTGAAEEIGNIFYEMMIEHSMGFMLAGTRRVKITVIC